MSFSKGIGNTVPMRKRLSRTHRSFDDAAYSPAVYKPGSSFLVPGIKSSREIEGPWLLEDRKELPREQPSRANLDWHWGLT